MSTIPIHTLSPAIPPPRDSSIRGIITLLWPYSSSTKQCAFLLADPDFRLRSRRGQVRVRFSGACAEAVARAKVGIGEEVVLELEGARWVDDESVVGGTPGRSVEGELVFGRSVGMRVVRGSGEVEVRAEEVEREGSPVREERREEVATPMGRGLERLRGSISGVGGPNWIYSSPAFIKRVRLSGEGLTSGTYDPFVDDETDTVQEQKKSRRSFGGAMDWRYVERSPSPTKETFEENEGFNTEAQTADPKANGMLPPPPPRLALPSNTVPDIDMDIESANGPSTPKLLPVKSPTLPLPSPFPQDAPKFPFLATSMPMDESQTHMQEVPPVLEIQETVEDGAVDEHVEMHSQQIVEVLSDTEPDTDDDTIPDEEPGPTMVIENEAPDSDDETLLEQHEHINVPEGPRSDRHELRQTADAARGERLAPEHLPMSSTSEHVFTSDGDIKHARSTRSSPDQPDDTYDLQMKRQRDQLQDAIDHQPAAALPEVPKEPVQQQHVAKPEVFEATTPSASAKKTPQSDKERIRAKTFQSLFGFDGTSDTPSTPSHTSVAGKPLAALETPTTPILVGPWASLIMDRIAAAAARPKEVKKPETLEAEGAVHTMAPKVSDDDQHDEETSQLPHSPVPETPPNEATNANGDVEQLPEATRKDITERPEGHVTRASAQAETSQVQTSSHVATEADSVQLPHSQADLRPDHYLSQPDLSVASKPSTVALPASSASVRPSQITVIELGSSSEGESDEEDVHEEEIEEEKFEQELVEEEEAESDETEDEGDDEPAFARTPSIAELEEPESPAVMSQAGYVVAEEEVSTQRADDLVIEESQYRHEVPQATAADEVMSSTPSQEIQDSLEESGAEAPQDQHMQEVEDSIADQAAVVQEAYLYEDLPGEDVEMADEVEETPTNDRGTASPVRRPHSPDGGVFDDIEALADVDISYPKLVSGRERHHQLNAVGSRSAEDQRSREHDHDEAASVMSNGNDYNRYSDERFQEVAMENIVTHDYQDPVDYPQLPQVEEQGEPLQMEIEGATDQKVPVVSETNTAATYPEPPPYHPTTIVEAPSQPSEVPTPSQAATTVVEIGSSPSHETPDDDARSQPALPNADSFMIPDHGDESLHVPSYPSLPLSPSNSQSLLHMQSQIVSETVVHETLQSVLPPTPQNTQDDAHFAAGDHQAAGDVDEHMQRQEQHEEDNLQQPVAVDRREQSAEAETQTEDVVPQQENGVQRSQEDSVQIAEQTTAQQNAHLGLVQLPEQPSPPKRGVPSMMVDQDSADANRHPADESEQLIDESHQLDRVVAPVPAKKKTPVRKSLSSRISNVPEVISAWFSPKRSTRSAARHRTPEAPANVVEDIVERTPSRDQTSGVSAQTPQTSPKRSIRIAAQRQRRESLSLEFQPDLTPIKKQANGMATSLAYFTPLSRLQDFLNVSSQQTYGSRSVDVFAVVTDETKEPSRAKSGPRDYFTVLHSTDTSLPVNTSVRAEIFRPWKATLPVAEVGDVILLREFTVKSRNRQPYLLSTDASAWCVWRFAEQAKHAEVNDSPRKARRNRASSLREEVKGPPIELGEEEREHAQKLRRWWEDRRTGQQENQGKTHGGTAVVNGHA